VDEAQHLSTPMLSELQHIHDEYEVGLALVGNLALHGQVIGGKAKSTRKPAYAQFYSRLGFRLVLNKPKPKDVDAIIAAWGVSDAESVRILKSIAQKAGGLREVVKTIKSASKAARGLDRPLDARLIAAAWAHRDHGED